MTMISWLLLGVVVGLVANLLKPGRFPLGVPGAVIGGTAGAFIAGGTFTAITGRGISGFDPVSLVFALAGAVALLVLIGKAGYVEDREPHPHTP